MYAITNRYVEQTDIHNLHSTVAEALHFSTALRNAEPSQAGKWRHVAELLTTLELEGITHVAVGAKRLF
eukprot:8454108-Pyramimonas_sp.AAC.1